MAAKQIEVRGIVLRSIPYGDNSRLVTILTREKGKILASARGAQSAKSKLLPSLQLFSKSDFRLSEAQPTGRLSIQAARLLKGYESFTSSFYKMSAASYAMEALDKALEESESDPVAYSLLNATLSLLESKAEEWAPFLSLVHIIKLLGILGVAPHLASCVSCGAKAGRYAFSAEQGGLVCPSCYLGASEGTVSELEASYMEGLLRLDLNAIDLVTPAGHETDAKLIGLLNKYYIYTFSKPLQSYDSFKGEMNAHASDMREIY